jgi:hypothetical protein
MANEAMHWTFSDTLPASGRGRVLVSDGSCSLDFTWEKVLRFRGVIVTNLGRIAPDR